MDDSATLPAAQSSLVTTILAGGGVSAEDEASVYDDEDDDDDDDDDEELCSEDAERQEGPLPRKGFASWTSPSPPSKLRKSKGS
jgi:hypothetical protein